VSLEKRPGKVIYGKYWLHDSFCIFEEADHLETYSAEVVAIRQCTTTDQLAQLIPTLNVASPPWTSGTSRRATRWIHPGTGVKLMPWPMATGTHAYRERSLHLPPRRPIRDDLRDSVGCEVITTVLSGDYLGIPLDKEPELLAAFAKYGIEARRDDRLIEPFSME
jgi:hypothetical protein